jgi:hypothetical protein
MVENTLRGRVEPAYDCSNTASVLDGSGIRCPAIDEALMHRYLRYLRSIGFLDAPETVPADTTFARAIA